MIGHHLLAKHTLSLTKMTKDGMRNPEEDRVAVGTKPVRIEECEFVCCI